MLFKLAYRWLKEEFNNYIEGLQMGGIIISDGEDSFMWSWNVKLWVISAKLRYDAILEDIVVVEMWWFQAV